jgi:prepilin-type N-terminal cleavage/methylation domain-containing protein
MKTLHRNQNGFTIIEILIVVAVLALVGFVSWKFVSSQQQKANLSNQITKQLALPESLEGVKSIDEIMTLAASDIAARQVLAAELEQEDEGLFYSIKLSDGTVLVFDAKTGNKVQLKAPNGVETEGDEPLPADFKPTITMTAAIQTAKAQRVGKTVEKVELKVEDGIVVYSVRFSDKGRVDVDATTGSVLRVREQKKPDVKTEDNRDAANDRGQQNNQVEDDSTDDNNDVNSTDDNDTDDNDGDDGSSNSGSGSSNSGSGSDSDSNN